MKSMIKNRLLLVTAICFLFAGTSCQYDEIVDIPYPESLVYLPIAVNGSISPDGIYTIEEGASTAWVSPTPGQPMKYTVRNADNAFVIPLGIYRSGTGKTIKGSVNVSVMLNADTVQTLIDNGVLTDVEVLYCESSGKRGVAVTGSCNRWSERFTFDCRQRAAVVKCPR